MLDEACVLLAFLVRPGLCLMKIVKGTVVTNKQTIKCLSVLHAGDRTQLGACCAPDSTSHSLRFDEKVDIHLLDAMQNIGVSLGGFLASIITLTKASGTNIQISKHANVPCTLACGASLHALVVSSWPCLSFHFQGLCLNMCTRYKTHRIITRNALDLHS